VSGSTFATSSGSVIVTFTCVVYELAPPLALSLYVTSPEVSSNVLTSVLLTFSHFTSIKLSTFSSILSKMSPERIAELLLSVIFRPAHHEFYKVVDKL
jgi:hypothetical protein